jgi:hypothetical protein
MKKAIIKDYIEAMIVNANCALFWMNKGDYSAARSCLDIVYSGADSASLMITQGIDKRARRNKVLSGKK